MKQLTLPKKLNQGDKIAVIIASWGGPGTFPYRYEIGKQRLESVFGLEVLDCFYLDKKLKFAHTCTP